MFIDIVIVSNFKQEKHHKYFFPRWYHIEYGRGLTPWCQKDQNIIKAKKSREINAM